ncbi:MAG: TonB-dependent receptor [Deltaproteobacteria bacterium]|nr:TonB-dependent receptor [Deltaproteobacteria bacterium]
MPSHYATTHRCHTRAPGACVRGNLGLQNQCSRSDKGRGFPSVIGILLLAISSFLLPHSTAASSPAGKAKEGTTAASAVSFPPGTPLLEALLTLSEAGLRLVYTDQVVLPEMRVQKSPRRGTPRQVLEEILEPHGLAVRAGPAGTLGIVPVSQLRTGRLSGEVTHRETGQPIDGVEISFSALDLRQLTETEGEFQFPSLPAGRHQISIHHPSFLSEEASVRVRSGQNTHLTIDLNPTPVIREQIDALLPPSPLPGDELGTFALQGEDLDSSPQVTDDVLRTIPLLPGAAGSELSVEPSIRGGRGDQVTILLDGQEILEPYHLRDFGNALSIISSEVISEARLLTGSYPVEFGSRLSGVLDLTSTEPSHRRRFSLGLSLLEATGTGSGSLRRGSSRWLLVARNGLVEVPLRIAEEPDQPRFADIFGKIDHSQGKRQTFQIRFLASEDRFGLNESGDNQVSEFKTSYGSAYGWLNHQFLIRPELVVETRLSWSQLRRRRGGLLENLQERQRRRFEVADQRSLESPGLSQSWAWSRNQSQSQNHLIKWGFDFRRQRVSYDYANQRLLDPLLADLFDQPEAAEFLLDRAFQGNQIGVYGADQLQRGRFSFELGLRFDESSIREDEELSPRFAVSFQSGPRSRFRLGWGRFFQVQRPSELQVEDGLAEFQPAELADEGILGFEHRFLSRGDSTVTLRIEAYEKRVLNPRVRFENISDPISKLPEAEPDRTRIDATRGRSRGLEIFLSGRQGQRFDWLASYTLAGAWDRVEGRRVAKPKDQEHALSAALTWRFPRNWQVGLGIQAHTGWPTTEVFTDSPGESPNQSSGSLLGPLYEQRLDAYWRFDASIRKRWSLRRGEFTAFLDLQNVTDHRNQRGFEVTFEEDEQGNPRVTSSPLFWAGIIPNLGFTWSF